MFFKVGAQLHLPTHTFTSVQAWTILYGHSMKTSCMMWACWVRMKIIQPAWVSINKPYDFFLNSQDNLGVWESQLDNIHVEYHPSSHCDTEIFPFFNFSHIHFSEPTAPDPDQSPWYAFCTLLNFEAAKLSLDTALNQEQSKRLIKLMCWAHDICERFTLRSHSDLWRSWDASGMCLTPVSVYTLLPNLLFSTDLIFLLR